MRYGYIGSFKEPVPSAAEFSKEHFDFLELTLHKEPGFYNRKRMKQLKKSLSGLTVIAHLHWELDLNLDEDLDKILKHITLCKRLGIKRMGIHPSAGKTALIKGKGCHAIVDANIKSIRKINAWCKKQGISLLVENVAHHPFNKASVIKKILERCPGIGITLDIGHANMTSKKELESFLRLGRNIKHIHLHDNSGLNDHTYFKDENKLLSIAKKIKKRLQSPTATLEIFGYVKNNVRLDLDDNERRKILLMHLKALRSSSL